MDNLVIILFVHSWILKTLQRNLLLMTISIFRLDGCKYLFYMCIKICLFIQQPRLLQHFKIPIIWWMVTSKRSQVPPGLNGSVRLKLLLLDLSLWPIHKWCKICRAGESCTIQVESNRCVCLIFFKWKYGNING